MFIEDLFKEFCKERHAEDKGRNYNLLQEIYANTELFDMSLLNVKLAVDVPLRYDYEKLEVRTRVSNLIDYTLPFPNMFLCLTNENNDISKTMSVFIREYSFFIITGTIRVVIDKEQFKLKKDITINVPFTIHTDTGSIIIDGKGVATWNGYLTSVKALKKSIKTDESEQRIFRTWMDILTNTLLAHLISLTKLPKHSVIADVREKAMYYSRKKASTIKVVRPIYYVLDCKKEELPTKVKSINACGTLHYDHSFKVRGHWRRLTNPKTLGKDRNGEYKVQGVTFVKPYTKGDGDLIKRVRIIK